MDDVTENVGDLLAEDGVVGVPRVGHIKGYVFSPAIVLVTEGYWQGDFANCVHFLTTKAIEGVIGELQEVSIELHVIEG